MQKFPHALPLILGWDVSGIIHNVGRNVVTLKKGDEVYGCPDLSRDGAYAEYIVVKESEITLKPKTIDHIHAAAIPLAGLTAWQALFDIGGLTAGKKIFIHGAAGGIGSFALQFAKWQGAYVIAASYKNNYDLLKFLGADEIIDYESAPFENLGHTIDLVLDTIGDEMQQRSLQLLKKDGILASLVTAPSPATAAAHRIFNVQVVPQKIQLAKMAELVDSGKLKVIVENVFPLQQAYRAHELSERKLARGKIILQIV